MRSKKLTIYTIAQDRGAEAPRFKSDGTLITEVSHHERLWQSMRILNQFSLADLSAAIPFEFTPSIGLTKKYVNALAKAGYLMKVRWSPGRVDDNVYQINPAMNKGPLPPIIKTATYVYD